MSCVYWLLLVQLERFVYRYKKINGKCCELTIPPRRILHTRCMLMGLQLSRIIRGLTSKLTFEFGAEVYIVYRHLCQMGRWQIGPDANKWSTKKPKSSHSTFFPISVWHLYFLPPGRKEFVPQRTQEEQGTQKSLQLTSIFRSICGFHRRSTRIRS
jgi:hypothetical protein